LVSGDFNTPTAADGTVNKVDWASLPAHNWSARLVVDGGPLRPNLKLDHVLELADLFVPAVHLADLRADPRSLQATGRGRVLLDPVLRPVPTDSCSSEPSRTAP
jgi:hypothetical protein